MIKRSGLPGQTLSGGVNFVNSVKQFHNEYNWLSNFYENPVTYKGLTYSSSETAYQAHKSLDIKLHQEFVKLSPKESKKLGQKIKKRDDWDKIKVSVMYDIIVEKFSDKILREKLLNTGDDRLIEGNWWHDCYWGHCYCVNCIGYTKNNFLGKILMLIRERIRSHYIK